MKYPLVSVIIPNYNHSLYLSERIDSVLNQKYDNIEIIILDDKSTDNSIDVINLYKNNPKVSSICVNEFNSGSTFRQWEKGISLSKGDYIWIAESDDKADDKLLSTIMNEIINHPSCVIGFCNSSIIDSNGNLLNKDINRHDLFRDKYRYTIHEGVDFLRCKMLYENRIYNASSVVFKKECWYKIDKSYINYKLCGDWFFWLNILMQGDIVWVHKNYNMFRTHLDKVTPKAFKNGINFKERKFIYAYIKQNIQLSPYKKISIFGNLFISLIKNKDIQNSIRLSEILFWIKKYPFIPIYSIIRLGEYFLETFIWKTNIIKLYKQPINKK